MKKIDDVNLKVFQEIAIEDIGIIVRNLKDTNGTWSVVKSKRKVLCNSLIIKKLWSVIGNTVTIREGSVLRKDAKDIKKIGGRYLLQRLSVVQNTVKLDQLMHF